MRFKFDNFIKPLVAGSLIFSSSVASAAPVAVGSSTTAMASACGAAVTAGAAVAAQVARPGCVLPAVEAGVPVPSEAIVAQGQPFLGGLLIPVLGLAAFASLFLALSRGGGNNTGSLSRA